MPDIHSGYGFAIGNVAAFDMGNPEAVVSPGGVGFDINCGVRLIRTNLVRLEAVSCCNMEHYTFWTRVLECKAGQNVANTSSMPSHCSNEDFRCLQSQEPIRCQMRSAGLAALIQAKSVSH